MTSQPDVIEKMLVAFYESEGEVPFSDVMRAKMRDSANLLIEDIAERKGLHYPIHSPSLVGFLRKYQGERLPSPPGKRKKFKLSELLEDETERKEVMPDGVLSAGDDGGHSRTASQEAEDRTCRHVAQPVGDQRRQAIVDVLDKWHDGNRERKADEIIAALDALPLPAPSAPECPYCGETEGLRQTAPTNDPTGPDYSCEPCFTPSDEGPCFDDLPEDRSSTVERAPDEREAAGSIPAGPTTPGYYWVTIEGEQEPEIGRRCERPGSGYEWDLTGGRVAADGAVKIIARVSSPERIQWLEAAAHHFDESCGQDAIPERLVRPTPQDGAAPAGDNLPLLENIYAALVAHPFDCWRVSNQALYALIRDRIAKERGMTAEEVQNLFEANNAHRRAQTPSPPDPATDEVEGLYRPKELSFLSWLTFLGTERGDDVDPRVYRAAIREAATLLQTLKEEKERAQQFANDNAAEIAKLTRRIEIQREENRRLREALQAIDDICDPEFRRAQRASSETHFSDCAEIARAAQVGA